MKKYFLFFTLFVVSSYAQDEEIKILPQGLGLWNQLEYSYDIKDKREILENWLNLDYQYGIFSAGIRFDVFQPNDPNPSISRGKERFADIDFKYIKADYGNDDANIEITAGNYYAMFGRGLVIKSYEDRNIRVDNNLLGLKVVGKYKDLRLTALSGEAANSQNIREDIIHAFDAEYNPFDFIKGGFTYSLSTPNNNSSRTNITSFRLMPSFNYLDFYFEYGMKFNRDDFYYTKQIKNISGKAFYGSGNFYFENLAFIAEYKYYDNFGSYSADRTIIYNTPPAVRNEYSYLLLNRHPSPLYQDNEQGYRIECLYNFGEENSINLSGSSTRSLDKSSLYKSTKGLSFPASDALKEVFLQVNYKWSDFISSIVGLHYNEEFTSSTKNRTAILENRLHLNDYNTLRIILEHQQTYNFFNFENYYDDVLTAELLHSPDFSVSFVSEMLSRYNDGNKLIRRFWNLVQFGYKAFENAELTLLVGSRQAGNICIGGVCRYEPEFRGVEFKMITRL